MRDIELPDEERAVEAAAKFDESLARGLTPKTEDPHLDSGIAGLIQDLHQVLGNAASQPVSNFVAENGDRLYERFHLLRRAGSGTYGVVYLAHDPVLRRDVALKIPRLHTLESDDLRRRFVREAHAVARLKHPHIVQVLQAELEGDEPYIATEYCRGPNLDSWLRSRRTPVDPKIAAEIVANLADALGCAHAAGVLHRDVKPGNVLLAEEAINDADLPRHVRLADFGMARLLEQAAGTATADGALMGTFAYMAPEQVHRDHGDVGPATDVHALGAILYELLTLQKPYGSDQHSRILLRICNEIPQSPHQWTVGVPRDLEAICLKCLEKSPARRYRDGRELAADLRRYLTGEPTLARPLTPTERFIRMVRRNPWGAALVGGILAASLVVILAVTYHNHRLGELLQAANSNLDLANARQRDVTNLLYVADMRIALQALGDGDPATVRRQLDRYRSQPDVRGVEWSFLDQQLQLPETTIDTSGGPIYSCVSAPDGAFLATASQDGIIRLWDVATRTAIGELHGHKGDVNDVAFNADGTLLISAGDDQTARIWDVGARSLIRTLDDPKGVVYGVAISPDGTQIATGGKGKTVRLWTFAGDPLEPLGRLDADIEHLQFSPDGKLLAVASGSAVRVWRLNDRQQLHELPVDEPYVAKVSFSSDGRRIAAGGQDRHVYLWDVESGDRLAVWTGHRDSIHDVEFLPGDQIVLSSGRDGTFRFWTVPGATSGLPRESQVVETQTGRVWSATPAQNGRTIVASSNSGVLQFWTTERLLTFAEFGRSPQQVTALDFSPSGERLAVRRDDSTIAVWDVLRQQLLTTLDSTAQPISFPPRFSPDGAMIATGHDDGAIRLWPADGTRPPVEIGRHDRRVSGLCFAPHDLGTLYTSSHDGTVRSWNLRTGAETHRVEFPPADLLTIAISHDGSRLACNDGNHLLIWDLPSWTEAIRATEPSGKPESMEFSADDRMLVCAHGNHVLQLWDLERGGEPAVLTGHDAKVMGATFSADGRTIASASADGTLRFWHVPTRQEIGVLYHGQIELMSLRFSKDGRRLAAGYKCADEQSGLLMWSFETQSDPSHR